MPIGHAASRHRAVATQPSGAPLRTHRKYRSCSMVFESAQPLRDPGTSPASVGRTETSYPEALQSHSTSPQGPASHPRLRLGASSKGKIVVHLGQDDTPKDTHFTHRPPDKPPPSWRAKSATPDRPSLSNATRPLLLPYQEQVASFYASTPIQVGVATFIFVNFLISAVHAQILPMDNTSGADFFRTVEVTFAVLFTLEVLVNLYGNFFLRFWQSGWNCFDFIIVAISLASLPLEEMPGIGVLRLFRAFRVFRLFKRVPSLRGIIEGVFASLPGVGNAFLVLFVLMGIWSIMGVEFFREDLPEEFGNFFRAMFTMWQMMTMDGWASGIARPIIFGKSKPWAALFFISYIFVAGIVMANVVVAILLEKYLTATRDVEEERLLELEAEQEAIALAELANSPTGSRRSTHLQNSKDLQGLGNSDIIELIRGCTSVEVLRAVPRTDLVNLATQLWNHAATKRSMTAFVAANVLEVNNGMGTGQSTNSQRHTRTTPYLLQLLYNSPEDSHRHSLSRPSGLSVSRPLSTRNSYV